MDSRKQHQTRHHRNRGREHGDARESRMRVDRATAASFEAPSEKGNREKQGGGEQTEPGVKSRERRPISEPSRGYRA